MEDCISRSNSRERKSERKGGQQERGSIQRKEATFQEVFLSPKFCVKKRRRGKVHQEWEYHDIAWNGWVWHALTSHVHYAHIPTRHDNTFYMEKWRLLPAAGIKFVQYIELQPKTITLIGRSSESHKIFEPY